MNNTLLLVRMPSSERQWLNELVWAGLVSYWAENGKR